MRKMIFMMMPVIFLGGVVMGQPPAGPANPGTKYGEGADAARAFSIEGLPGRLDSAGAATEAGAVPTIPVTVRATVLDVCPKKGCWLRLRVNDSTTAFVRMKDYGFFLPLDIKGRTIVLDADASMKTTSVAELRHYAEDAKRTPAQIAAITSPRREIRLTAKGIVVE